MSWYLGALQKYATFSGRSRRKEYWYFVLFNFIVSIVLAIVDVGVFDAQGGIGPLSGIYSLAVIIPGIAVGVRRLHDTDRSGWWLLIALVPLIGAIVILVFTIQDGTPGDNTYGPSPKLAAA